MVSYNNTIYINKIWELIIFAFTSYGINNRPSFSNIPTRVIEFILKVIQFSLLSTG